MRCILVLAIVAMPISAHAQQHDSQAAARPRLIISERAIADGIAATTPPARAAQPNDDSVTNGALIGAVIGAAIMGGYVTFLCNALQEPSDPSCLGSSLLGFGLGAAIGAGAGLGIDLLIDRQPRQFPLVRKPQGK